MRRPSLSLTIKPARVSRLSACYGLVRDACRGRRGSDDVSSGMQREIAPAGRAAAKWAVNETSAALLRLPVRGRDRSCSWSASRGAAGLLWHFSKDLPDYSQLQDYEPPVMTRVHATDGSLVAEYATRAPALSADPGGAEDGDQRLHRGRGQEFLRARRPRLPGHRARRHAAMCRTTASSRRPQGASTITQQVAKNFLLTNEVSLRAQDQGSAARAARSSAPIRRTRSSSSISTKSISASAPTASPPRRCSISTSRCTS